MFWSSKDWSVGYISRQVTTHRPCTKPKPTWQISSFLYHRMASSAKPYPCLPGLQGWAPRASLTSGKSFRNMARRERDGGGLVSFEEGCQSGRLAANEFGLKRKLRFRIRGRSRGCSWRNGLEWLLSPRGGLFLRNVPGFAWMGDKKSPRRES